MGKDEPVRYVCSGCGHRTTTRTGRCPSCGAWGTLEAESGLPARPKSAAAGCSLSDIAFGYHFLRRGADAVMQKRQKG